MPQDTIWLDYHGNNIIVNKSTSGIYKEDSLLAEAVIKDINGNITTTPYHKLNSYYADSL
jgi:hypothetical protein